MILKRRKNPPGPDDPSIKIIIVSGSCCFPGMRPFDEQAESVIGQAIAETGVPARVKTIKATTAYFGGVPRKVMRQLMATHGESDRVPLPAVLINGKLASQGVPKLERMKEILNQASEEITS